MNIMSIDRCLSIFQDLAMKIIFDKLKEGRSYPVTHRDIRQLFKILPDHWIGRIKLVHFLGQEPHASRFSRPVRIESMSYKLNLSILGLTKDQVIKEILIELIQESGDEPNLRSKSFRELDKNQIRRINDIMATYVNRFNNSMKENDNN